jgi:multidrug transporter EmrE-like cation transporter
VTARILTLTIVAVLMSGLAQVLFKVGVSAPRVQTAIAGGVLRDLLLAYAMSPGVWGGLFLYGLGTVLWLGVLARVQLSLAYPFVALGFVLTAMLGYFFFDDDMSAGRISGTLLVIAGVYLVARS